MLQKKSNMRLKIKRSDRILAATLTSNANP